MTNTITPIIKSLKEVNDIIDSCSGKAMSVEHPNVIARFYYDYQDTNVIIDEAETMAAEDAGRLRVLAVMLKDETATLLNNMGSLDRINFREIANEHSKQYYSRFQEASEQLIPYWKQRQRAA